MKRLLTSLALMLAIASVQAQQLVRSAEAHTTRATVQNLDVSALLETTVQQEKLVAHSTPEMRRSAALLPLNDTPDCNVPITALPWSEDFEATQFPSDCWIIVRENTAAAATLTWARNTTTPRPGGSTAHARHMNMTTAAAQVQTSWLISPAITIPATGVYELNFWTRFGAGMQVGRNAIYISTTDTELDQFSLLVDLTPTTPNPVPPGWVAPPAGWHERIVSLEAFAGQTIHIAFRYVCRGGTLATSNWDIDDVLVQRAPVRVIAQTPATNAFAVPIDDNIVLTFNQDITVPNMAAITVYPALAGMSVTIVDDRNLTITHNNFAYSTVYTVTIPAGTIVGLEEVMTWSFRSAATCAAPTQIANFFHDFEAIQGIVVFPPDCWVVYSLDPVIAITHTWESNHNSPRTAGGSLLHARHPAPGSALASQTSWLITEAVAIPATDVHELVFWTRWVTPANNELTAVYISTTGNAIPNFVRLQELTPIGSAWQHRAISLEAFAGQTIHLAFKYVSRGAGLASTTWDVDDVRIQQSELRLLSLTPENTTLEVELDQDIVIEFNIDITVPNLANITVVPQPPGMQINIVGNRNIVISHSGFAYETTYVVTVPAGTIVGWDEEILWRFRTEINCDLPASFPWSEGFEGFLPHFPNTETVFPPNCWTVFRTNPSAPATATWQRSNASPRPGSTGHMRHARLQLTAAQPTNTSWIITRALEVPATGLSELNFWDRFSWGDNGGQFDILISNTTNELSAFQQLHSVEIIPGTSVLFSPWRENAISLAQFAGETVYIAFRVIMNSHPGTGAAPFTAGWDVDDISIQSTPVRAATLTPDRNALRVARDQDIVIEFNQDVTYTTLANVVVTPTPPGMNVSLVNNRYLTIAFTGLLAPSTVFTVTVPPGTIAGFSEVITWWFRTEGDCNPMIASQVIEDFDFAIWPPDCWVVVSENSALAETWVRSTATPIRPGSIAHASHAGPGLAAERQTSWLITRAIEMPTTGIYELSFWARWVAPSSFPHRTAIYVSTTGNNTADFSLLQELASGGSNEWQEIAVSLEAFAGENIYLAFKYVSRGPGLASSAWNIDDVSIQRATRLRIVAQTPVAEATVVPLNQAVTLTFNLDVTYTNLAGITVYPAVAGMNVNLVNNRAITITHGGFAPATIYTITIPAGTIVGWEDGEEITWSFRTMPVCAVIALPLREGFDHVLFPPDCWTIVRENLDVVGTWARNAVEPLRPGSTGHARHPGFNVANQISWLITERMTLPATGIFELSFWNRFAWGSSGGTFGVWISTTDNSPGSFQLLQTIDVVPGGAPPGPWQQRIISLDAFAGYTIYVAFRAQAAVSAMADWDIDDVVVRQVFPYDIGVIAINQPASGVNLSSTTAVQVTVENVGLDEVTSFPIVLMLGETEIATEVVTATIPPGGTFVHTFTATVDLSAHTEHTVTAITNLTGDGYAGNDTLRRTVINHTFPYFQGFELTAGNSLPDSWTRTGPVVIPGNFNVWGAWLSSDGTSARTGLAGGSPPYEGNRQMVIRKIGLGHHQTDAWLFTPRMNLVEGVIYELSFARREPNIQGLGPNAFKIQIGPTTETVGINADGQMVGGTTIFKDITSRFHVWETVTVRYTATRTGEHYIGFHTFSGDYVWGMFIDNVRISEAANYNLEIITSFPYTQLPLSQTGEGRIPSAQARNTGLVEQTNVVFSATLNDVLVGETAPLASLAPSATSPVMTITESLGITDVASHTLVLRVEGDQGDSHYTDYRATFNFTTTENVFATDALVAPMEEGAGFGAGGIFAKVFEVTQTTTLCAVQVLFAARGSGETSAYTILVFRMDGPTTPALPAIAARTAHRIPGVINTVDFSDGDLVILEPGRYAVALFMAGFADISFDGRPGGAWYAMDPTTGAMTRNVGVFGSLGLRMVINDELSLEPVAKVPAEGATHAALEADIVVTFNTEIEAVNLAGITLSPPVTGITPSVVDNQLIIAHDGLAAGTLYTITIPAGAVVSTIADVGYNQAFSWTFTSVFTPADFPDPFDLAVDVEYATATLTWRHGEIGDIVYTQGFEGTTGTALPVGWSTTGQTWRTAGEVVVAPHTGTRQLASGWNFGGPAWAFSRGVELTAGETYTISFWWQAPGYLAYNEPDNFRVRIGTGQTAGAMVETIKEQITDTATGVGWRQVVFPFTPTTSGMFYLGFERIHPASSGNRILIDDISITTAVIDAESFTVFLGPNVNEMDSVANVTESSFVFENLTLNSYAVGVQAVGPNGLLSNIIPISFSITELPPVAVVDRTPAVDATDVALDATISVTFNQNVTLNTPHNITISGGVGVASANVEGTVLTITHDGFAYETTHTVTIPAGAIADFDEAITWSFTTRQEPPTSIVEVGNILLMIYPNPVYDILHIQTTELVRRVEIYNSQGTLVLATENITTFIDVSSLPAGVYVIRFITESGIVTQRFVKR